MSDRQVETPERELRVVGARELGQSTCSLAHLLAVLRGAARCLDENLFDIDARIVEAHAAELAAGRNWPGMEIVCGCGDCDPTPAREGAVSHGD